MKPTTYITRYIENEKVVALIRKFDPPCPPKGVYRVNYEDNPPSLIAMLHGRPNKEPYRESNQKCSDIELEIINDSLKDLRSKYSPLTDFKDKHEKFNPGMHLTQYHGEYEIF